MSFSQVISKLRNLLSVRDNDWEQIQKQLQTLQVLNRAFCDHLGFGNEKPID